MTAISSFPGSSSRFPCSSLWVKAITRIAKDLTSIILEKNRREQRTHPPTRPPDTPNHPPTRRPPPTDPPMPPPDPPMFDPEGLHLGEEAFVGRGSIGQRNGAAPSTRLHRRVRDDPEPSRRAMTTRARRSSVSAPGCAAWSHGYQDL